MLEIQSEYLAPERFGMLGWTALWMAILLVVFVPLALRAYRKRA